MGGGGTLRDWTFYNPYSVYFAKTNHCVSITIDGNTLTGVGVQPNGTQFDPFTIVKPSVHAGFDSSSPDWLGQVAVFTNTTTSDDTPTYLWAFGDGATSALANPTHVYALPGIYTVALTATIPTQSDVVTATVIVYGPPTVSFSASPTAGLRPLTVTFASTVTTVPPGDPTLAYLWRLGDGATSALSALVHTYVTAGVHTVTLTAGNAAGQSVVTRTNYITAYNPVLAGFTAAPRTGIAPLAVVFTNTTGGDYTTSLWRFGDGTTSTLNSPGHTYTASGVYTVTLAVSGPGGQSAVTRTNYITAYNPVMADFTAAPRTGIAPLAVVFTNTTGGDYTTSLWRFGDGTTSTLNSPSHTYTVGGVYTVTLTVGGPAGSSTMAKPGYVAVWRAYYFPLFMKNGGGN